MPVEHPFLQRLRERRQDRPVAPSVGGQESAPGAHPFLRQLQQRREESLVEDRPDKPWRFGVGGLFRPLRVPQQVGILGPLQEIGEARRTGRSVTPLGLLRASGRAVRKDIGGREVVEEFGLEGKTATGTGLALELIADPLWFLAPVKVSKLLRLPQLTKKIGATPTAQNIKQIVEASPLAMTAINKAGRAFITDYGRPASFIARRDRHAKRLADMRGDVLGPDSLGQRIGALPDDTQQFISQYVEAGPGRREFILVDALRAGQDTGIIASFGEEAALKFHKIGKELVDAGLIPEESFKALDYGYLRRVYKLFESKSLAAEHLDMLTPRGRDWFNHTLKQEAGMRGYTGGLRIGSTLGKLFQRRQKIDKAYAETIGEIQEAGYRVAKGELVSRDALATRKFYTEVARDHAVPPYELHMGLKTPLPHSLQPLADRVTNIPPRGAELLGDFHTRQAAKAGYDKMPGYTRMPNSKSLGPLADQFLPDTIARDILRQHDRPGALMRKWRQGVGWWKYGKVVLNPATHSRNMMSNMMLAHMAGVAPFKVHRYVQAARSLSKQDKWYQEVASSPTGGFLHNTFAGVEMPGVLSNAETLDDFQKGVTGLLGGMKAVGKKFSWAYETEEQFFKMAFYIDQRKAGASINRAIRASEDALFNYRKVPELVDTLRTTGIVPFATFTAKAIPATAKGLYQRPAVLNEYGNIFRVFEEREGEDFQTLLPKYMRDGWMPLGKPDSAGNVEYLNMRYILPFTDVFELTGAGGPPSGQPGQPRLVQSLQEIARRSPPAQLVAAIIFGADPFTGKPFKTSKDWNGWAFNFVQSPLLPGGYAFRELSAAARGVPVRPLSPRSQPRGLGETIAASVFGVRTRTINLAEQRQWRVYELSQEMQDIRSDYRKYEQAKGKMGEDDRQMEMLKLANRLRHLAEQAQTGGLTQENME